ncbi:MAG: hypothetical protein IH599_08285, partial [Bacteroidales bacterium]|nr:hypothetical protein [Bacteroidales bacterium]
VNAVFFYFSFFRFLYVKENIYPSIRIRMSRVAENLKISIPIIPYTLALVLLNSSDRIVMERMDIPVGDIGIYSLSYRMANYMFTFVAGIIAALTPRLQLYYRSQRFEKFQHITWLAYLLVIYFTVIGSLMMKEVFMVLVRNPSLHIAAPLASIAVFAASFHIWYYVISLPLFINERTRLLPWLILIPAGLSIILNIILIPIYGYQVALWVTFISYLFTPWMGLAFGTIRRLAREMMPNIVRYLVLVTLANSTALFICYKLILAEPGIRLLAGAIFTVLIAALAWYHYRREFPHPFKKTREQ